MKLVNDINHIINIYNENKLSHAFLIESNNIEKCLDDVKKKINDANNKINKDLLDVAKLTKDTNEVIKNMLKHWILFFFI